MNGNLGPPPINVLPIGLLDFFGIKNGGRYPQELVDRLQGSFDLTQWYMEAQVENFTFSRQTFFVASASAGFVPIPVTTPTDLADGTNLFVPSNQLWIVLPGSRILAGFSANAGQEIEVALIHRVNATDQFVWWPTTWSGRRTSDAGIITNGVATLTQMVFVPPGAMITGYHYGALVPAGDIDVGGTLRLVRLTI
jgi:hypothetical protein